MKITRFEALPLQIPLKKPFKTARAEQAKADLVLVKLHTDRGVTGFGECDPKAHITGETVDSVLSAMRYFLAPAVQGLELNDVDDLHKVCLKMDQALVSNPSAKAGIDIAAHDALGKAKDLPVHALLGSKRRQTVESCGFTDLGTVEEARDDALKYTELGCTSFKIKVSQVWASDVERIEAVRSILGSNVDLIVDPNQDWSVDQTIKILGDWKGRITVCEQPIPWNDMEGLTKITQSTDVTVMADEAVWSPSHASILLRLKAANMVNIKHLKSGGLHHGLQIAQLLQAGSVDCTIGSTIETGVSSAASVHLAVVCPGLKYFDVAPPTKFLTEDVTAGLSWRGCIVEPSDRPGLGVELKESLVNKYTVS